jgi:hypothetical protein
MKGPKDSIGNTILKGDLVRLRCEEMIGEVTELKTGGVIVGNQVMPAKITINFSVTIMGPPDGSVQQLLCVKKPPRDTLKDVEGDKQSTTPHLITN